MIYISNEMKTRTKGDQSCLLILLTLKPEIRGMKNQVYCAL
jgi:hypothetical protein